MIRVWTHIRYPIPLRVRYGVSFLSSLERRFREISTAHCKEVSLCLSAPAQSPRPVGGVPSERASDVENFSMSWYQHELCQSSFICQNKVCWPVKLYALPVIWHRDYGIPTQKNGCPNPESNGRKFVLIYDELSQLNDPYTVSLRRKKYGVADYRELAAECLYC